MQIFLSWSGKRSKYLAESLRSWLPKVIQSVRPWMSDEDIAAGSRWLSDVSTQLSSCKVGILCVTPENQSNPWLLFEGGALSRTLDQAFVCPAIYDMAPSELVGPLSQFQAITFNRDGMLRLIENLNTAVGSPRIDESFLKETFDVWWPKLEERLKAMPDSGEMATPRRSDTDMLSEILENQRELLRRDSIRIDHSQARDERMDTLLPAMESIQQLATQFSRAALPALTDLQSIVIDNDPRSNMLRDAVQSAVERAQLTPQMGEIMGKVLTELKDMVESGKQERLQLLQDAGSRHDAHDDASNGVDRKSKKSE